jgi:probable DNA repair protein
VNPDKTHSFYDIDALAGHLQSGHLILTPTFRLARRIKLAWAQHRQHSGVRAWPTPRVMSLEQWWLHCYESEQLRGSSPPVLVTPQQELELWQACIESHPQTAALLRPRGAAQLARDAYRNLLLWEIDWREETCAQQFHFDPDAASFIDWARAFEAELETRKLDLLPRIAAQLAATESADTIVLAEFDELPPLYRRLLTAQAGELLEHRSQADQADCYLRACDDNREELLRAGIWARQRLDENAGARIGILVPGLEQQRHTVERILHQVFAPAAESAPFFGKPTLPVNFSAGVPLASCAPVRTALELLELVGGELSLSRLVGLLHSRYRSREESPQEQQLIRRLYRAGSETVSNNRLRYECSRIEVDGVAGLELGRQLLALSQQREAGQSHPGSTWITLFDNALEALGWPGPGPLDSQEYQQLEHWHTALSQLAELDAVCAPLDYKGALVRLQHICSAAVFQPQTPDAPIQVLGLLEAAGLEFDHLWLCGMSSGEWPPSASPSPFIPDKLQQQHDMPHSSAGRELHYAQSLLDHYCHATGELVASYSRLLDSVDQQPSPMVAAFTVVDNEPDCDVFPAGWSTAHRQDSLEHFVDNTGPPVSEDERHALGGGSGLIADQSQCPFRAFAKHRLKLEVLPEPTVGLTASDRGTLLHDALFHLWGALESREKLAGLSEPERTQAIALAVRQAIESFHIHEDYALGRALLDLEQRRLQQLLERWLDIELERGDFEVIAREQDRELELGELRLNLRIDRVDRLPDGRQLLIDYKSGQCEVSSWLGPRPREPQLPLYGELVGDDLDSLAFVVINKHSLEFRGVGQSPAAAGIRTDIDKLKHGEGVSINNWQELRHYWQQVLQNLAQDFIDGRAGVDPADPRKTCTYCGLEALCRVQ